MTNGHETRQTGVRELSGIILLTFGLLMALALISYQWQDIPILKSPPNNPPANYIGPAGAWFSFAALMAFGIAAILLPVGSGLIGIFLLFSSKQAIWRRVLWWTTAILAVSGLIQLHPPGLYILRDRLNISGIPGGILGWLVAGQWLGGMLGTTGAAILIAGVLTGSLFMFIGRQPIRAFLGRIFAFCLQMRGRAELALEARRDRFEKIAREEREIAKQRVLLEKAMKRDQRLARLAGTDTLAGQESSAGPAQKRREMLIPVGPRPAPVPEHKPESPLLSQSAGRAEQESLDVKLKSRKRRPETAGPLTHYQLPPLDLLQPVPSAKDRKIQGDVQTTARILKETLAEFGIETDVINIEQGPVVTRYELLPAPGIRVEKISQLSNNLALTLKATSVRIQAPIPGKGVVGIEVPNAIATRVYLREILESETWRSSNAAIPLILGKDVAGNDLVADLTAMPHLLIAGATGSGKTVCINSILAGLLMSQTPEQLRLMLVDPKIVEFAIYDRIPHLVVPVISDPKKVPLGLRWAIAEMEKRYKLFARAGVRTIQSYNSKQQAGPAPSEAVDDEDESMPAHIPYIVIVIDELADLMSIAQSDVENAIARLAQLSRAVGIHMILATQRPSVNVITGTIKANFPARVSFQVAQKVDSRTILDTGGADKLLGRGDMLILPPGTSKLVRAQGAMTTDEDINAIVGFVKKQAEPNYEIAIKETIDGSASAYTAETEEDDDEMLNMAINIIRETQRASVSLLQRRMKIGYNRAGRLMDVLEDRGIVGPAHGSDPREILIDLDNEMAPNTSGDEEDD